MTARPRVIRTIRKRDRLGRAKIVTDRKEQVSVERIRAHKPRPCDTKTCKHHNGLIQTGEDYARMYDMTNPFRARPGLFIPTESNHHFDCLPHRARFLLRFFKEKV